MAGANSVEEVPKWKIALAIGVPIGVGMAAIWYYKNKSPESGGPPDERPHHVPRMVDPDRTDVDSVLSETSVLTEFVKVSCVHKYSTVVTNHLQIQRTVLSPWLCSGGVVQDCVVAVSGSN